MITAAYAIIYIFLLFSYRSICIAHHDLNLEIMQLQMGITFKLHFDRIRLRVVKSYFTRMILLN